LPAADTELGLDYLAIATFSTDTEAQASRQTNSDAHAAVMPPWDVLHGDFFESEAMPAIEEVSDARGEAVLAE
jgi:hypothetical protein